ncbi:hypothetical protein L195_g059204, partial [Trifolium pratense]
DAALSSTENKAGLGACIRVDKGQFVAAMTASINAKFSAAEAEAWCLQQSLQWISTLGYTKVLFEMDCKMVVDDVHNNPNNSMVYSSISVHAGLKDDL